MNLEPHEDVELRARRTLSRADYEQFLPMVRRIAMKIARKVPSHILVGDLISCGWIGLTEAFNRADPKMPPNEFEAYASYRIKGAMLDYLRGLDPSAREARNASRRIARTIATLTKNLNRQPEESEIAKALDLSEDEYRCLLTSVSGAGMARLELVNIDQTEVESPDEAPDEEAAKRMIAESVASAIESLPTRLQQVLALYYQEECTLKEIGSILGVSESRVCQLHTEAMHRLRAAIGRD
jgi:RNA polymerase sigma factor for flagellar operon FliA